MGAEVEAHQSTSSGNRSRDSSRGGSRDSSRDRLSNSGTLERKSQTPNPLRPLPESLTFDMRLVNKGNLYQRHFPIGTTNYLLILSLLQKRASNDRY